MKLLEINDLKERKTVPDSYEIGLVYKGASGGYPLG